MEERDYGWVGGGYPNAMGRHRSYYGSFLFRLLHFEILNLQRLYMEPGVHGPHGLPAVQIAFNLDVETAIIPSLPMEGDTVRVKDQEGGVPVGQDLKENTKNTREKETEEENLQAMIWTADTVLAACVNVSFIVNKSMNNSI